MSQVNNNASSRSTNAEATHLAGSRASIAATANYQPPPQARRDFDAALRRASDNKPRANRDEDKKDEPKGLATLAPMTHLPSGLAAATGGEAMAGSAAGQALPQTHTGPLPTAMPAALAGQTQQNAPGTAIGQQWRMQVPLDAAAAHAAALALRLTQSGNGQWQVRVGTDNQTRQQLMPHVESLRERLRERGQGKFDDFSFDDDLSA